MRDRLLREKNYNDDKVHAFSSEKDHKSSSVVFRMNRFPKLRCLNFGGRGVQQSGSSEKISALGVAAISERGGSRSH